MTTEMTIDSRGRSMKTSEIMATPGSAAGAAPTAGATAWGGAALTTCPGRTFWMPSVMHQLTLLEPTEHHRYSHPCMGPVWMRRICALLSASTIRTKTPC